MVTHFTFNTRNEIQCAVTKIRIGRNSVDIDGSQDR